MEEIAILRKRKYFDCKCVLHETDEDIMRSGEEMIIPPLYRCNRPHQTHCGLCGVVESESGHCFTWLQRLENGQVYLRQACPRFLLGLNDIDLEQGFCEPCTMILIHETERPLPYQTNSDWLRLLPHSVPILLPDLLRIIADYDGYDPSTRPLKRCDTCGIDIIILKKRCWLLRFTK